MDADFSVKDSFFGRKNEKDVRFTHIPWSLSSILWHMKQCVKIMLCNAKRTCNV